MTNNFNDYVNSVIPPWVKDKKIMITGGTTGIGRATALLLAALGNDVFICGHHEQQLHDTLRDFEELNAPGLLTGIAIDLATEDGIRELFEKFDQMYDQLDILINNAAIAFQSVKDGSYNDQAYILRTNVLAYLACAQAALYRMEPRGAGHIVNVGSMSADIREAQSSVYVCTKGGIQAFTESLRKEANPKGIQISLIEPGSVGTDMQPYSPTEQRKKIESMEMLYAEDIARSIVFMLSQPERTSVVSMQVKPLRQII
ncbi:MULTISPECIES: SDR family oxidoreductase [Sphingobacterium]|uniref:Oxidoreductase n=1 Tax=Sphingobacterium athyrii TaxID=2152717 RepID=A0A363NTZ8_9SPHI|nr:MULTISPECIES: SDR family oxidoreductase [Sphingobacterium]PUV24292.1 oxidoreductase [Sphingobacterium athyrii]QIH33970.1 SDR family oxidoreductase [Sphingobacterium sp. DR205]